MVYRGNSHIPRTTPLLPNSGGGLSIHNCIMSHKADCRCLSQLHWGEPQNPILEYKSMKAIYKHIVKVGAELSRAMVASGNR